MYSGSSLLQRVRRAWRALWPVLVVVGGAVTCDNPLAPKPAFIAVAPKFDVALIREFSGLSVDQVRLVVTDQLTPPDTLADKFVPFSVDSTSLSVSLSVNVTGSQDLNVTIQLLSAGQVVFTGTTTVTAIQGATSGPATPVQLSYKGPGSNIATLQVTPRDSGTAFSMSVPFKVTAMDSSNNPVTSFYVSWAVHGPAAASSANVINANGVFTAATTRGPVWIVAHTPSNIWDSTKITVTPVASQIQVVSGGNQSGTQGTQLTNKLVVKVLAADNLPVVGVPVTFTAPAGGSVNPTTAPTDTLGFASTTATLGNSTGAQSFTASVSGVPGQATFGETSTAPCIAGTPFAISANAGQNQSAQVSTTLPVAPSVKVTDCPGTPLSGVQVIFHVASGGGSSIGDTVTTNGSGIATVGSWTLGSSPGANTLTASVSGVTPFTFNATATPGPAIAFVIPGNSIPLQGGTLPLIVKLTVPAPAGGVVVTVTSDSTQYLTVSNPNTIAFAQGDTLKTVNVTTVAVGTTVLHASGTGYTSATQAVVVSPNVIVLGGASNVVVVGQTANLAIQLIPAPSGPLTVTLASSDTTKVKVTTPTVNFAAGQANGTATVQGVAAGPVGISATAPNYALGFALVTAGVAGQPTAIAKVAGDNQTVQVGTAVPVKPSVKVTDIAGNAAPNAQVIFAVLSGGGSSTGDTVNTNASGVATVGTWTIGGVAGTNQLSATVSGIAPVIFTATGSASGIASTTVSPHSQTLTALGQVFGLSAQAKDGNGNNVAGHFTWTSRNTAVATVDTVGHVTAVANGTSYVVATEAGGTSDSALITVNQTVASINVTPSTKTLYLLGQFNYTAQAVDGLGHPVPGVTHFTWSTTAPAVATVDTAGHVTAVGIGTAQIRAASGLTTGIGNLTVITPITKIVVAVDSGSSTKLDTATMIALGINRRYHAFAYDTLNALMSGLTFSWASTNGAVAQMLTLTSGDTASVVSAANGVTNVTATAQGFISAPAAYLTVAQQLSSIELKPDTSNPSATIGVGGIVHVSARGKDGNNRYIAGGTFKYASANTGVATVDSVTGNVTGVANGTAGITATSGAITSNVVTVTVSGSVPPIISFFRDTVSVGRGSTQQIPILLSVAPASPLTINLAATAFAHWQSSSVIVPTGQTSVNATLVGDSAGTTQVTATDGSSLGYAAGHAVAKVTANMRLSTSGYAIDATDIVTTQVLLSDPSPAGGTYVTFNYSTGGIAQVSPDPAFIPAGQLAADIQIRGLAAGSTNITPNAIGVNGQSSSFNVYAPVLTLSQSAERLGAGQYETSVYVYIPTYTNTAVPVTITSSDTNIVTVPTGFTIPAGQYYSYFTTTAKNRGVATLTVSAPGWTSTSATTVTVTSPKIGMCCSQTGLFTTSPVQSMYVYAEDSVGTNHYRINSLAVSLHSTDTTVVKVLDTLVTIQAGQYYNYGARDTVVGSGSAYIIATASGHFPDSIPVAVQGPPLAESWGNNNVVLGAGQTSGNSNSYIYLPNYLVAPLLVHLTSSDSNIVSVPDSLVMPAGTYYQYFTAIAKAPGTVTITATAPGYQSASTGHWIVTTPRLSGCCNNTTIDNFSSGSYLTVYSDDSLQSAHYQAAPLAVSVQSTDTNIVKLDSATTTIAAGQYYTQIHYSPVNVGTARLIYSAPGHAAFDTVNVTVRTPALYAGFHFVRLGKRQHEGAGSFYAETPSPRPVSVLVTYSHTNHAVDSLTTDTLRIDSLTYYKTFDIFGLQTGTDTVVATAPGYKPDTGVVVVTTPRYYTNGLPGGQTTTSPPFQLYVYPADSTFNLHYSMDTLRAFLTPTDSTVIQPQSRILLIPANNYYNYENIQITGPGTAQMIVSDSSGIGYLPDTTGTITVTGPQLYSQGPGTLGMRQHGGPYAGYVQIPNTIGSNLWIHLLSTDTRVVTVPDSVLILAGTSYTYFDVTARDTIGTIQVQMTAPGYGSTNFNVQVGVPKFVVYTNNTLNTTSPPQAITVDVYDQANNLRYPNDSVTVTLIATAPNVVSIDSTTVTIPAGQYYSNTAHWSPVQIGTSAIQAIDQRSVFYKYTTGSQNVTVQTPSLGFSSISSTLGIGQYQDYAYVYTPDNAAHPIPVTFTNNGFMGTFDNLTTNPNSGVTIDSAVNYKYFRIAGLSRGRDSLIASTSSPFHNPATVVVQVDSGRVDPISGWPGSINVGDSVLVTMYSYDPQQGNRPLLSAETFTLAPNANIEFRSGGANSTVITQVVIPAGGSYGYVQFYLKGKSAGTGSVSITNSHYKTYTNTVTVQ